MTKRVRTSPPLRCSPSVKARVETGVFAQCRAGGEACPRLDAAARTLRGDEPHDLCGVRVAALAFKLVVRGAHPIAVAHAVDDEGAEHWLAVRAARAEGGA